MDLNTGQWAGAGMHRNDAAHAEEAPLMSRWLVLPLLVLPYIATAASGAAPRDRDHDRLPDRWEKRYALSTSDRSAKGDPDRDGLRNLREYRLRTQPRKRDTDGDGLRDGVEVRRYHTNPRRKDTDRDGYSDGVEVRAGTNPNKRKKHPPGSPLPGTPTPAPPNPAPSPTGFPAAGNTGVPAGGALTLSAGITVRTAGAVVDAVDAPWIRVEAANVTIRNSRVGQGTSSLPIVNRSTGLVVEDTTIVGRDGTGISFSDYTARRVEVTGTENGFQAGNNVTIVDSWVHDLDTSGGAHTDGIQFSPGAGNVVIRHNNLDPVPGTSGATSPIIMHTGADPQNHDVWIEDNRLDGTGSSVSLYCPRSPAQRIYVNRNRMLRGVFGGYTDSCRVGSTVTEFSGNVDDLTGRLIG